MSKRSTTHLRFFCLAILLAFAACTDPEAKPQPTGFPAPHGPYEVGTRFVYFTDSTRAEILTRDTTDRRSVAVRIFYPAVKGAQGKPIAVPFDDTSLIYHHIEDAPFDATAKNCPVILLSPGFGATYLSNVTLAEELASNGYLVLQLGHPYFNEIPALNGKIIAPFSNDTFQMPDEVFGPLQQEAVERFVNIQVDDIQTVLDLLNAGVFSMYQPDVQNIGVCGYSGGGTTAARLCTRKDAPTIRCGVNLNGVMYGFSKNDSLRVPFLAFNSDLGTLNPKDIEFNGGKALSDAIRDYNNEKLTTCRKTAQQDYTEITIKGTTHMDFWDGAFVKSGFEGPINATRCHDIIRMYVSAFFNAELKHTPSKVLTDTSSVFPEVDLIRFR